MNQQSSPSLKSLPSKSKPSNRSSVVRWASVLGLGTAACAAAVSVAVLQSPARAESPTAPGGAAAAAGDMKPFTQDIPGLNGVKFDLVAVPGGKFKMGSADAEKKRGKDEGPQVEIEVEPFYMGKHEVTWDVYNEFLNRYNLLGQNNKAAPVTVEKQADAVSYPTPIYDIDAGPALQRMGGREGKLPASIMSHFAAKQFTKWLSAKTGRFYRLPTEAEWEYAARGGKDSAYSFGADAKDLEEHAWFVDNSELPDGDPGYRKVGMKKPNGYGLHDMHGNVAEIVIDQYDPEWYKSLAGKGTTVSWRDAVRWPDAMYPRVVRGGGYESEAEELRSAARKKITVSFNTRDPQSPKSPYWWTEGFTVGFRVVSPVKEPSAEEKAKFWEPDNESLKEILKRDREIRELIQDVKPKQAAAPATAPAVQTAKSEK